MVKKEQKEYMGKDIEDLEGDNQSMRGFLCEEEHDMISETWLV